MKAREEKPLAPRGASLAVVGLCAIFEVCAAARPARPAFAPPASEFVPDPMHVVAAPPGVLSGTVVSAAPDHASAGTATVFLRRDDGAGGTWRALSSVADAGGRFRFEGLVPGFYDVFARSGADIGVTSRPLVVTTAVGWSGVDVHVSPGATLKGAVVDETGRPVGAAEVSAVREGEPGWEADAETGSNGVFRLEGLFPGRYSIRTRVDGVVASYADVDVVGAAKTVLVSAVAAPPAPRLHHTPPSAPHTHHEDESPVRLRLPPAPTDLDGIGVDDGGRPLTDFTVYAVGPWSKTGQTRLVHDPAGAFGFTALAQGAFSVFGEEPGGRVAAANVVLGPSITPAGVRLVFRPGVRVVGTVVDADTRRGMRANVQLDLDDGLDWRRVWTQADGSFSLDGVPPDTPCRLSVIETNGRGDYWTFRSSARPGRVDDAGRLVVAGGEAQGHTLSVVERSGE